MNSQEALMRVFIAGVAFVLCTTTALAQEPSRWTVSVGPEWTRAGPNTHLWGARLRAEYDLTRLSSVFGLRLEGGARWGPTQSYFYESGPRSQGGVDQSADIMLGLSGAISPFPRGRFSPYVTMGVSGRQSWRQGSMFVHDSTLLSWDVPNFSSSRGDIIGTLGLGLRARLGGRSFQLELRRIYDRNGLTFGTRLPF
jgi:hypothetical protein